MMNLKVFTTLILSLIYLVGFAQSEEDNSLKINYERPVLNISDDAPSLYIRKWINGNPIKEFEKGKIYILEFWATWCKPCIAAMPHLSELKRAHHDKIEIIAVNVLEDEKTTDEFVKQFVEKMGDKMDFHVAIDDNNKMIENWKTAAGVKTGIPLTFVVNEQGKLSWIGHPNYLESVLNKMLENTWDIKKAYEIKSAEQKFESLEDYFRDSLLFFRYDLNDKKIDKIKKTQLTLDKVNEFLRDYPELKESSITFSWIFSSLLILNQSKAHAYGTEILNNKSSNPDNLWKIAEILYNMNEEKEIDISPEIFFLGADAFQEYINKSSFLDDSTRKRYYKIISEWYLKANEEKKANEALQKSMDIKG